MKEYWNNQEQNRELAQQHLLDMEELLANETFGTVRNARVYNDSIFDNENAWNAVKSYAIRPETIFMPVSAIDALFATQEGKTLILDFASYTTPGGNYLDGGLGQEESLCHASNLYNVLNLCPEYFSPNQTNTNQGLYNNRAMYLQDIQFEKDGVFRAADVIVCSAPNKLAYTKFGVMRGERPEDIDEVIHQTLQSRIGFLRRVIDIANNGEIQNLILGAWGCGKGGNDPFDVARLFETNLYKCTAKNVIFAVPNDDSRNYKVFKRVFG